MTRQDALFRCDPLRAAAGAQCHAVLLRFSGDGVEKVGLNRAVQVFPLEDAESRALAEIAHGFFIKGREGKIAVYGAALEGIGESGKVLPVPVWRGGAGEEDWVVAPLEHLRAEASGDFPGGRDGLVWVGGVRFERGGQAREGKVAHETCAGIMQTLQRFEEGGVVSGPEDPGDHVFRQEGKEVLPAGKGIADEARAFA